jgi:hypothetical protein
MLRRPSFVFTFVLSVFLFAGVPSGIRQQDADDRFIILRISFLQQSDGLVDKGNPQHLKRLLALKMGVAVIQAARQRVGAAAIDVYYTNKRSYLQWTKQIKNQ